MSGNSVENCKMDLEIPISRLLIRWFNGPFVLPLLLLWASLSGAEVLGADSAQSADYQLPATGAGLYAEACASCHGLDGRGQSQERVGFATPLPDFTQCNFATREPNADWVAVAHDGGPTRGFSRNMPAFGKALEVEHLRLIMQHVRTFCPDPAWPRGELNLPRAMVTEKAYPEDEAVYTIGVDLEGRGAVSNELVYEQRFGARNQIEVVVPFGWRESVPADGGNWLGSVGDVALGAKSAIFHSYSSGSIFSVAGEFILPTADESKGFGKGTTVFEPFVAFGQILPSDFFLQSQAGLELPFDQDKAEKEGFWRFALGRSFTEGRFGRVWSPMLEFLGGKELVSGEEVQWDVLPQLQFTLNTRQHVMLNIGVRLPVTDAQTRDTRLYVYLLWDWFDGGFLEGW